VDGRGDGGRGGWGSGFFGSIRGRNGSTGIASPPAITSPKTNTEAERHENSNGGGRQGYANHVGNDNPNGGLGAFIEKKSGNVELLGRKEMTAPVLTAELAAKVRALCLFSSLSEALQIRQADTLRISASSYAPTCPLSPVFPKPGRLYILSTRTVSL
jgi:hypothetical protein